MTHQHTLLIKAGQTERHYWKDLWRYRELFFFLAWRDILVRYKQTAIGIAWALLRPVVFTLVFSKLAKLPSDGVPYPILVFATLIDPPFFHKKTLNPAQDWMFYVRMCSGCAWGFVESGKINRD